MPPFEAEATPAASAGRTLRAFRAFRAPKAAVESGSRRHWQAHHRPDHRRSRPGHQTSHRHRPQPDERRHLGDCADRRGTAHHGPRRRTPQHNGERRIPRATVHRRRRPVCHRRVLHPLRSRSAEAARNTSEGQIARSWGYAGACADRHDRCARNACGCDAMRCGAVLLS